MEIERLGENKIRCAISEEEIHDMGFSIDDIIGNTETTQQFMRVVLNIVEERENINIDNISPMVKAELLQDHSMSITFGGDNDNNFRSLVDTVNHLMSCLEPDKMREFSEMSQEEKKKSIDEFLKSLGDKPEEDILHQVTGKGKTRSNASEEKKKRVRDAITDEIADDIDFDAEIFENPMLFGLEFMELDEVIEFSKLFGKWEHIPPNSLYKMFDRFFLLMDFQYFSKEELRPLAFAAVEYDNAHCSDILQITYVKEHGKLIMKEKALETLMQL